MFRSLHVFVLICILSLIHFSQAKAQEGGPSTDAPHTTEKILSGMSPEGEKIYLVRYKEDKYWRVDQIVEHADGWEDLLSRKYYNYKSEADEAQTNLQSRLTHVQTVTPLAVRASDSDMRVLQGGVLWPTTQQWSWDWEKKYAQWLQDNMNVDFYNKYKIATDCADVAYSARWIFARIHGLPAANRLSGSGALFTNQSLRAEWAKLPTSKNWYEDKRFRAALNYLLDLTYTHALFRDSYPVAITPENFMAGIHHLDLREQSGHTQLVHRVDLSDTAMLPYMIIQSTTPRQVRTLTEGLTWGAPLAKKGQNGFLRILWPKIKNSTYTLEKPENMPGYSLEQYAPDFIREKDRPNFVEVLLRLKPGLNFVSLVTSGYNNLIDMFKSRIGIVEEGYSHCPNHSCAEGSSSFDDWSTPSRDHHIAEAMDQLGILTYMQYPADMRKEIDAIVTAAKSKVVFNLDGVDYQLKTLMFAWANKMFSSDPNDEPGLRWGLAPEFFGQKLQRDITKTLVARKNKIDLDADNSLRTDLLLATKYCSYFTADQCDRLKATELQKPLSVIGQTRAVQEWLEAALWLNSDPAQTSANQWGGLRATSKFQKLGLDVLDFYVTVDGTGFMQNADLSIHVGPMGINGINEAALPAGFAWQAMDRETSMAWAAAPGQILRHDFKTGTETVFALPQFTDIKILKIQPSFLVVASAGQLWSLEMQGAQLVPVWNAPQSSPGFFKDMLYIVPGQPQSQIFDFAKPIPHVLSVEADLTSAVLYKTTPKYIGIVLKNTGLSKKIFFVERATGKLTDVTFLGTPVLWSEGLTKALIVDTSDFSYHLISLDENFQVIDKKKIAPYGQTRGTMFIAFSVTESPRLYQMKGEDFVEVPRLSDEKGARDFFENYVLMGLKEEGKYRLRNIDTGNVIYEGGPIVLMPNRKGLEFVLQLLPDHQNMRLISLKNPRAPALLIGDFFNMASNMNYIEFGGREMSTDRGLLMNYQSYQFWVEF